MWSICTRPALALVNWIAFAVYGSCSVPAITTQSCVPGRVCAPVRSRRRMSLRVSQPLWPPATVTSSDHAWPNASRLDGYSRDAFGQAWSDDVTVAGGHNGCDTRNDILRRDLTGAQTRPGTHDCVVIAGTLQDPYTAKAIQFTKAKAGLVQIDHIVPLAYAWRMGARNWPPD